MISDAQAAVESIHALLDEAAVERQRMAAQLETGAQLAASLQVSGATAFSCLSSLSLRLGSGLKAAARVRSTGRPWGCSLLAPGQRLRTSSQLAALAVTLNAACCAQEQLAAANSKLALQTQRAELALQRAARADAARKPG